MTEAVRIVFSRVAHRYDGGRDGPLVLSPMDLTLEAGAFTACLGPSGCGKSTLLRLASGLEAPWQGSVHWGEARRPPALGMVFQDPQLLPWRTVEQNVALPLELQGVPSVMRAAKVAQALEEVALTDARYRLPRELSGGMRMRTAMARALVTEPALLLLDEPFAALDERTRQLLEERLRALWLRRRCTVLLVTHTLSEALFLAQRVLVLSRRPARIVSDVPVRWPEPRTDNLRYEEPFARLAAQLRDGLSEASA